MLTRIDHVMICPPSLEQGIEAYTRIGFDIHPGGASSSQGTHNAIAFLEDDYLELASISDRAAYLATSPGAKKGLLILRVEDAKKALKLLQKK